MSLGNGSHLRKDMKVLVTGSEGFIGKHVVNRLRADGHMVYLFDRRIRQEQEIRFISALRPYMDEIELVIHLAANADVRHGPEHPQLDFSVNTDGTRCVLEAMRKAGVKRIAFTSTGSVYGEPQVFPTPEDAPFPVQTSLYAASKLAGEALISAYCEAFGMTGYIFRLVSVLGEGYTHGHVLDFYNQLQEHPEYLDVLGDGTQRKSYIHVSDVVEGMMTGIEKAKDRVNIFNLGTHETVSVIGSIGWIAECLGLEPEVRCQGGKRGWVGDSPLIHLDCSRLRKLGWVPKVDIPEAVIKTVQYLQGKNENRAKA